MDARPRVSQNWLDWLSDSGSGAPSHQSPSPSPSASCASTNQRSNAFLQQGDRFPPSPPSPLLLDATRSPFAPTPILCFSQLRLGQTVTAVIPSTARVSWHLLADLEVDPWRPSFCPRRPSSTSLLVVRIQARGLGSRNITVGRCLPDSPTSPLSLPPPQRCLIPQSPPSSRPN